MRDPARIDVVLAKLRAYWMRHPDLRLGQLVLNVLRDKRGAVDSSYAFNAEEAEFMNALDALDSPGRAN